MSNFSSIFQKLGGFLVVVKRYTGSDVKKNIPFLKTSKYVKKVHQCAVALLRLFWGREGLEFRAQHLQSK